MDLVVCDAQRAYGDALASVLSARGHRVVTVPDGGLPRAMSAGTPQVCVLELGAAVRAREVADLFPHVRIFVLTGRGDARVVRDLVAAGAVGAASTMRRLDAVVRAIEEVGAGRTHYDPMLLRAALRPDQEMDDATARRLAAYLTPREVEVLRRIVRGEDTRAMAGDMGVSITTVRSHVQNVLGKLNVHSRLAAVAFSLCHGLVSLRRDEVEVLSVV
ncbi:response regulator transcription factor [Phytomonospora sp. NPDC050363]|uniref:response regulator transcription factor n=1 Tax=Phytomonospora sp. NPDC050363 TaxID=3155642 RepID=UPI00340BBDA0